jgi:hypothetical protein
MLKDLNDKTKAKKKKQKNLESTRKPVTWVMRPN